MSSVLAQQPGSAPGSSKRELPYPAASTPVHYATLVPGDSAYRTTAFTFTDITVFSYFDGTQVTILSGTTPVASFTLNADTLGYYHTSQGVYSIVGNKPFTVLIGDAITNYVNGYFAFDASGLGTSTKFNTWMMFTSSYDPHFIIFAYKDNTQFTVRNLNDKSVIATGTLNQGKYFDFPNVSTISSTPLQVTSNLPVSVLSYTDQDYYVPSSTGLFSGNLFYGFSGIAGGWANSITIVSYSNNNQVVVKNIQTGDSIKTVTLSEGQVDCIQIYSDTYWSVTSSGTVAVANIPFGIWSGSYAYLARSADRSGRNVGTFFYIPTISNTLQVFSFDDNNLIKIYKLGLYTSFPYTSVTLVDSVVVGVGGTTSISTDYGSNVYKVISTKNVSVIQSSSGYGADFFPLNFSMQFADLSITSGDITFVPESLYVAGDRIKVRVKVTNQGAIDARDILVYLYEGDPDVGGIAPLLASAEIAFLAPGTDATVVFDYLVPNRPEYKQLVVKVDPLNAIIESNESNNKASRFLKPNQDVQPPIAVNVAAPNGLLIDSLGTHLIPNPFKVQADLFNTGTVSASNVRVVLSLNNGLTLFSGPADTVLGNISANSSARVVWWIMANKDSTGLNLFSLRITADNAPTKDVRRAVNIPDVVPPNAPQGLTVIPQPGGTFVLSWNANSDKDLTGYRIYYSPNDTTGWGGNEAMEGPSPIVVGKSTSFTITGMREKVQYRFAIKASDYSNNLSAFSNIVVVSSEPVPLLPVPKIVSIWDVPADNGKLVFVKWKVSKPAAMSGVKNFAVWYWNRDSLLWVHVKGGIESLNDTIYSTTAPTVYDSTKARGMYWSIFRVSAHGVTPELFTISPRDSGYSLDNIAPSKVLNLTSQRNPSIVALSWKAVMDPADDVVQYVLYRSDKSGFIPTAANKVGVATDTSFTDTQTDGSKTYYYRVAAVDYSGNIGTFSDELTVLNVLGVESNDDALPKAFELSQNFPNPFNPSTTIRFGVPRATFVSLKVYNELGQEVASLVSNEMPAGYHTVQWNAAGMPSGMYFYKMQSQDFVQTKKLLLMK
jgi:hypothetical protein